MSTIQKLQGFSNAQRRHNMRSKSPVFQFQQRPLVARCRPSRRLCAHPDNVASGLPPAPPQPPSSPSSNALVRKLNSSSSLPIMLAGLGGGALLGAAAVHLGNGGEHATLASAAASAIDSLKEFGPADLIAQSFGPTRPVWSALLQHSHQAGSSAHHHIVISASSTSLLSEVHDLADGAADAVRGVVGDLCDDYNRWLKESPLTCKIVTGNFFTVAGDMLAQLGLGGGGGHGCESVAGPSAKLDRRRKVDLMRTGRLCLETSAFGTPLGHWWFNLLDTSIMPDNPHCPTAVLTKMLADQVLFAPLGLLMFFAVIKCLEGRPRDLPHTLQNSYIKTLLGGYLLWPLAGILNFALLPNEYRLLFNNCVNIIWTCFLSIMSSEDIDEDAKQKTGAAEVHAASLTANGTAEAAAVAAVVPHGALAAAIETAVLVAVASAAAGGRPSFAYATGIAVAAIEAVMTACMEQELTPSPVAATVEQSPTAQPQLWQPAPSSSLPFAPGASVCVCGPCLEVCQEPVDALYETR